MTFGLFSGPFDNGLLTNEDNSRLKFSRQLKVDMADPILFS
jgi:hypothetical protein